MTTKTLELYNIEQKIFWVLAGLLGLVLSFYMYSVMTLTFAVVDRNTMNAKTHELANTAGALEAEYLAQANSVTLSYAESLGFKEVNPKYAGSPIARANDPVILSMAR